MSLKHYRIFYVVGGAEIVRETEAITFLSATINAGLNIRHRPSLKGATIRSIKEIENVQQEPN